MTKKTYSPVHPNPVDRLPYHKPEVKRVRLALEETLATNCKVHAPGSPCGPESNGESLWQDGS